MKHWVALCVASALLLSGCGYKGDIYPPGEDPKAYKDQMVNQLHKRPERH
ncbi:MAG: lipoprotein [Magnetococcales bacterium]|nr:lipoprotein [Magnetococcales bacterium]